MVLTLAAASAGFCTYFSMYAFRKPFTAATFDAVPGWTFALDYKAALVIAQVAGYALSKLLGVKIVSETPPAKRAGAIVALVTVSWLALVLFAVTPAPWNLAAIFLNGLPLGLIWGLVFGFMEGRRTSELLGAVLCASFIVSSGAVKSVGKQLMVEGGVSPFWMPAATGAVFFPLLLISVLVLYQLPPPDAADEAARVRRAPMDGRERADFLAAYAWPVALLVAGYVLLTAFRDFRDNFAAEIWRALGSGEQSAVFTASELPVAIVALTGLGAVMLVRDNRRALATMLAIVFAGFALIGASTLAFEARMLSPLAWMIATGAGVYLAYTPFNAMLFDRLLAFSGRIGTAGFLIYVADASGYVGSVGLLVWRNVGAPALDWLRFFMLVAYATSALGILLTPAAAAALFAGSRRTVRAASVTAAAARSSEPVADVG